MIVLIPEKVLPLGFLLAWCLGTEDGLQRVGVIACVPRLSTDGHGRWREVLNLFKLESELAGEAGQLGHILLMTARMTGDEVGDDLLVQALLATDAVEDALEVIELLERGFAHEVEHTVAGVLWGNLQTAADVAGDEFTCILAGSLVGCFVLAVIKQQVVAHAAADEALLDARQGIDGTVDIDQARVVGVEVRTYLRMDAAGALTAFAGVDIASVHAVHVGRRTAEVAEIAFEIRHLDDLLHLFQYALLGAAGDELALMGRDGAEGAAAKASAMDVDAVLDHVVGGYALPLVFQMRLAGVRQVERGIELLSSHRRVGWIDDDSPVADLLEQSAGMHHVRLLFDVAEVLGLGTLVAQTLFMAVEYDVGVRGLDVLCEIDRLGQVGDGSDGGTIG